MLSGLFLIVDERVFNKKKYPDYGFYYDEEIDKFLPETGFTTPYDTWVERVGGMRNAFLRDYLGKMPLWR